jgi:hypothetical protein
MSWYFRKTDDINSLGDRAYQCLIFDDEFHITIQDLFDECYYIPQEICEDNDGNNEYLPSEVKLING